MESYASVSDPAILGSPKPSPWCSLPRQDSVVCLLDLLLSCHTGFALLTFVYFLLLLLFSCFFFFFDNVKGKNYELIIADLLTLRHQSTTKSDNS